MSAEKLIIDHLDLWTSAITQKSTSGRGSNSKLELTGIKKLRELILELAVRGKLVEQDPSDAPKVEACWPSWEITPKDSSAVEKLLDIPSHWGYGRLGDLVRVINGRAYKKHEMLDSGTPLLRVGNLFTSTEWYYSDL